jgi:hypothetical protein
MISTAHGQHRAAALTKSNAPKARSLTVTAQDHGVAVL